MTPPPSFQSSAFTQKKTKTHFFIIIIGLFCCCGGGQYRIESRIIYIIICTTNGRTTKWTKTPTKWTKTPTTMCLFLETPTLGGHSAFGFFFYINTLWFGLGLIYGFYNNLLFWLVVVGLYKQTWRLISILYMVETLLVGLYPYFWIY